jgi:DMSO/TMAO reductase YedYZ molybdopterin-dependent catalytic subunit
MPTKKNRFARGFNAGLLAGIVATILMVLFSIVTGGVSLPEALGDAIALAMPLPIFDYLHTHIGGDAKYYLFYIILVGQCLVFALFGGLCNVVVNRIDRWHNEQEELPYEVGLLFALVLWLFSGFIFLPLTGEGIFGADLSIGLLNTMISLAAVGIIFGLLFVYVQNWLIQRAIIAHTGRPISDVQRAEQRRSFLRNSIVVVGVGALGYAAWHYIIEGLGNGGSSGTLSQQAQDYLQQHYIPKITPPPTPNYGTLQPIPQQSAEITPNNQFYEVSKNIVSNPTVNGSTWTLRVDGEVAQPFTLTYAELMKLSLKKQYETMMCISNEVGGSYMSNALWEGIPLVDLLQRAGSIKPGATKVVLYAADSYSDSIHLAKALEPTTMVAVRMNGVTLPENHGYPARLLVPGIYGMKHVKWITHIEVVDTDYQGYWEQSGWSDAALIKMTSRIDTPTENAQLKAGQQTYIAGVAFSGNKGISMVQVSLDEGHTWQEATLQRPLSSLTWVLWQVPWKPDSGNYTLIVRAIDMQGNVQDPQPAPPLPDGSSGYHTINVQVNA